MSMKDQLLKAGLVNKKQVRKANQKAKKSRRDRQGSRAAKKVVEAQQRDAKKAEQQQRRQQRIAERRQRDRIREAAESLRRVDQILGAHRVHCRGGQQRFWFVGPNRQHIGRLEVPESIAFDLHCGRLAIAYRGPADAFEPDIVLIPKETAQRVERIDPTRILFHNSTRPTEPEDALWRPAPTTT